MRGMLLDLDDTLLDNKGSMARGFSEFRANHEHLKDRSSETEDLARWHEIADRHWARYEAGELSFQQQRLLKAQLLIALYSVRSDGQFCESLGWKLLFRWFLGMTMNDNSNRI